MKTSRTQVVWSAAVLLAGCLNSWGLISVGTGADGVLTVSGTNLVDGVKTKLTADGLPGATTIQVASEAGFGAGDEALVLCLQGPGAGAYEFATVASVNAGSVGLTAALQNTYDVAGGARVLVQRVPHFLDVLVRSNGVLTASAWTGGASSWTPGGVVAFRVKRSLMIEAGGSVTADALGFAGGPGVGSTSQAHGYQGESYGLTVGTASREPNLGAGGGGLYNVDGGGDAGGGGGGGGHGTAGANGTVWEPNHGLGGAAYGVMNLTSLFFGSGGGSGGTDDDSTGSSKGGNGGRGGGIVYIAAHTMKIIGKLSAAGANGATVLDNDGDGGDESGGGGGGAGGMVVLATSILPSQTEATLVPGGHGGGVESGSMLGGAGGTGVVVYAAVDLGLWSDEAYRDTTFSVTANAISNAAQFAQFAWLVNNGETYFGRTVTLADDIDLAAHNWVPVGPGFFDRFEGAFDGSGRTVSNICAMRPDTDYQGLFGNVGADGSVRNLTITNITISGHDYVGGVAGRSFGTLSNCTVRAGGSVSCTSYSAGGIAGCAEGALFDCVNGVTVTGGAAVGGIAGEANGATVRCRNSGAIFATGSAGGVACIARGALSDCSNSGSVESSDGEAVGGVAAYAESDVDRCANTGRVTGPSLAGGIVGEYRGTRLEACANSGEVTGYYAGGLVSTTASLVRNGSNDGLVIGMYAGGIVEDLWGVGIVRNCCNRGEVGGFASAGGLVRYLDDEARLENGSNSGAVMATDGKAGGLAFRNWGVVTNSYWKATSVDPFTAPAVWTNFAVVAACVPFGEAPGTLAAPVTVGGVTTDRLSAALNAWVSAIWTPGCGLYSWTAGSATTYPSLALAIEVNGSVIPQTLSDRFMTGIDPAQVEPAVAVYTAAHPGTTAASLGAVLYQADAMGFTFAELAAGSAILDFSPGLSIVGFDLATRTLTFTVSNGIDATTILAMNRLSASQAKKITLLRSTLPGGSTVQIQPTTDYHTDGTATATFSLPAPPPSAFFKINLGHVND